MTDPVLKARREIVPVTLVAETILGRAPRPAPVATAIFGRARSTRRR